MSQTVFNANTLQMSIRPIMKAVIREDYVTLTGDFRAAVVLNQLIYWTKRVHDFDKFLQEEYERNPECNVAFRHGWIIKAAHDLASETMLNLSRQTMRTILKSLIDMGLIEESFLEENSWDKTTKYRLNLLNLQKRLHVLGYPLSDFTLPENPHESRMLSSKHSNVEIRHSRVNSRPSSVKNLTPNIEKKLYTEIIPSLSPTSLSPKDEKKKIAEEMKNIWIEEIGEVEVLNLSESLISTMAMCYQSLFNGSLENWRTYCRKIASSKFLMGEMENKSFRKAWLSWVIKPDVFNKIEAGEYTLGDRVVVTAVQLNKAEEERIKQAIINSNKHPLWIEACLHMIKRVGAQAVKTWLLEMDITHVSKDEIQLGASNRFVRDWVNKNQASLISATLESIIGYPIQHLKIGFGFLPQPKSVEGESTFTLEHTSPSTAFQEIDAQQASRTEVHGAPQSPSNSQPSGAITAGHFSGEEHLRHNGCIPQGAMK